MRNPDDDPDEHRPQKENPYPPPRCARLSATLCLCPDLGADCGWSDRDAWAHQWSVGRWV